MDKKKKLTQELRGKIQDREEQTEKKEEAREDCSREKKKNRRRGEKESRWGRLLFQQVGTWETFLRLAPDVKMRDVQWGGGKKLRE